MPIVYSNVVNVEINKEEKNQEDINFDFSFDSIEKAKVKIRGNEEKGIKFVTNFIEKYDSGPSIKVKNEVLYLIPKQISDKVILKDDEKKIPKKIVDDIVDYVVSKNFNLVVKLGLEVGIKQPLNEPKIKREAKEVTNSDSKTSKKKSKKKKSSKKSKKKKSKK